VRHPVRHWRAGRGRNARRRGESFLHPEDFFMRPHSAARAHLLLSISGALATVALSANVMARDMAARMGNYVRHPLRDRCSRAFIALILVPVFWSAPPASAEIFKCVAKDATALYQNFPCEFDSIGWMPLNPQAAKTTLMSPVMSPAASQAKPKATPVNIAPPVNLASTVKSTYTGELRVGMSSDEVRALLGEPEEMVDDEPAEGGRISVWRYADGRSVQFDHKHHVLEVQR
jgi:hypothetical protein